MADYVPPAYEHANLVRTALYVAAGQFRVYKAGDPSQDEQLLAHRARKFVEAVNRMPAGEQPDNWVVADDPNAKAAWLGDKVTFLSGFNRELTEENEMLRERIAALEAAAGNRPQDPPVRMTAKQVSGILADMSQRVGCGDSFDGSISYYTDYEREPDGLDFDVTAAYRVGNRMGQGGMRLIRGEQEANHG